MGLKPEFSVENYAASSQGSLGVTGYHLGNMYPLMLARFEWPKYFEVSVCSLFLSGRNILKFRFVRCF